MVRWVFDDDFFALGRVVKRIRWKFGDHAWYQKPCIPDLELNKLYFILAPYIVNAPEMTNPKAK